MSRLHALAAAAPPSVFPAVGDDAGLRVSELALSSEVELARTPRHASILLVAGEQRPADREALWRVHDQLPHPRATLCWGCKSRVLDDAAAIDADADPAPVLRGLHRRLARGECPSEPDLLPDEPPNPWRGKGDFGQGGEGMMGGTPYGRMMPMPPQADLRDGLMLDAYTATVGPYLASLPHGLALEITWQGDTTQAARVTRAPLPPPAELAAPFLRALHEPVPIEQLERYRAAHHLNCIARVLELLELRRWARRCRAVAQRARLGDAADGAGLDKSLRRAGALRAFPPGLGRLPQAAAVQLGGPAGRASGRSVDVRACQHAYDWTGLEPVVHGAGDVHARLQQWLAEARQSLALARRARGAHPVRLDRAVESPWGAIAPTGRQEPAQVDLDFTDLLIGREWHEAVLILASFDAAALGRMIRWRPSLVPGATG